MYLYEDKVNTFIFFGHLLSFIFVTDNRYPCTPLVTHPRVTPQWPTMATTAIAAHGHTSPTTGPILDWKTCTHLTTAEYT